MVDGPLMLASGSQGHRFGLSKFCQLGWVKARLSSAGMHMSMVGIRLVLASPHSRVEVGCMGCRSGLYSVILWLSLGGACVGWLDDRAVHDQLAPTMG